MTVPEPALLDRLDAELAHHHTRGGQPGLAYGVLADGRLVHAGGFGERRAGGGEVPDADSVFRIASMTKSFTAALVVLLRDKGALRLDDPVAVHVPEVADLRGPTTDSPPLTVRTLLTMTGGLPTDDPWGDRQQALPAAEFTELLRTGLSFAWSPDTAFEYSNLGYALLGRVIEQAGGTSFRQALTDGLLLPLGLTGTVFEAGEVAPERLASGHRSTPSGWSQIPVDGYGAFAAMGGLFAPVRDLATWMAGFTDAFPPRDDPEGPHPLRRADRREMQQPHRLIESRLDWPSLDVAPAARAVGYGFGLMCERDERHGTVVSHSGGYPGFGSHMRWHPQTGLGVVVLANSSYAPVHRAGTAALELLLEAPGCRSRSSRRPVSAAARQPQPAPRGVAAWPQTLAARAEVDRLLRCWDDTAARRLFAANVDLDEPLAQRRARVEQIVAALGPLAADDASPMEHVSPAHCRWWLVGPHGRVRAEILLTPQLPPKVQALTLTPVPEPPAALRSVAGAVVAALAEPEPRWPAEVPTTVDLDRAALTRLLRLAWTWAGPCDLADVIDGDGSGRATFRLVGGRATLALTVALEPGGTAVRRFDLAATD